MFSRLTGIRYPDEKASKAADQVNAYIASVAAEYEAIAREAAALVEQAAQVDPAWAGKIMKARALLMDRQLRVCMAELRIPAMKRAVTEEVRRAAAAAVKQYEEEAARIEGAAESSVKALGYAPGSKQAEAIKNANPAKIANKTELENARFVSWNYHASTPQDADYEKEVRARIAVLLRLP